MIVGQIYLQIMRLQKYSKTPKARMRQNFNLLVLFGYLIIQIYSKLQVANYAKLDSNLQDPLFLDIPYSIANFGFAPFGKTMVANLQQSPGLNPECNLINGTQYGQHIENSFLMIPRGDCQFVTKAIHAQELGARMAIIVDNEKHQGKIIMKDNGYGYKVNIPAIFVNYNDGIKLRNLLNSTNNNVVLKINFQNVKTDKVDVKFYLQVGNRMSYYLVQSFEEYYKKISSKIDFQIVYDVMPCQMCSQTDCYCEKKYCSVLYQHGQSATGQKVLDQQLRESVMLDQHPKNWWAYMKCIDRECSKISQLEECSKKCVQKQKINAEDFKKKIDETFQYGTSNSVLSQHLQIMKVSGVDSYPAVYINNMKMKGSIQAQFIFDDICNTLKSPPGSCNSYVKTSNNNIFETKSYWVTVIVALIISAALFVLMFVFCKRWMRKRMTQDMNGRVDDMVSKYIEFYSERNNNR